MPSNWGPDTQLVQPPQNHQPFQPFDGAPAGVLGQFGAGALANHFLPEHTFTGLNNSTQAGLEAKSFSKDHLAAMQGAAESPEHKQLVREFVGGLAASIDAPIGSEEEKAIAGMTTVANKLAPWMDPRALDKISGGRSPVNIASSMHLGGQARMDPVTGFSGMSGASGEHVGKGVYQRFYGDEHDEDGNVTRTGKELGLSRSNGLESRELGLLTGELSRRGLVGAELDQSKRVSNALGDMSAKDRKKALKGVGASENADVGDLSDEQVGKLTEDVGVQDKMRSNDSSRVIKALDKYKGAISAVKEIFGDAGNPDAPMWQLFAAMEELTQGTSQQFEGGKVESTIRNIHNASKGAKVSIDGLRTVMGVAGKFTQENGMNPYFATQMTASGLNYRQAYNEAGAGKVARWGLESADKLMHRSVITKGRFLKSKTANRLGALSRMEDMGSADLDEKGKQVLRDMRDGVLSDEIKDMSDGQYVSWLAERTNMSVAEAHVAVGNRRSNEEYIAKDNILSVQTDAQRKEFVKEVGRVGTRTTGNFVKNSLDGMSDEDKEKFKGSESEFTRQLSNEIATIVSKQSTEERGIHSNTAISLRAELEKTEKGQAFLSGLGDDALAQNKELHKMATEHHGQTQQDLEDSGMIAPYAENKWRVLDPKIGKRAQRVKESTQIKSMLGSIASGSQELSDDMLTRFFQGVGRADGKMPKEAMEGILADTLKGHPDEKMAGKLATQLQALGKVKEEHDLLEDDIRKNLSNSPEERKERMAGLKQKKDAVHEAINEVHKTIADNDLEEYFGGTSEEAGKSGEVSMTNVTLNINGLLAMTDGKGDGKGTPTTGGRQQATQ